MSRRRIRSDANASYVSMFSVKEVAFDMYQRGLDAFPRSGFGGMTESSKSHPIKNNVTSGVRRAVGNWLARSR
jgi:hypothetical protein